VYVKERKKDTARLEWQRFKVDSAAGALFAAPKRAKKDR
jgi:hypothetical protein